MNVDKRLAAAVKQSVYYRNYRRARERALTRLSANHKAEYLALLEEEKLRDEANNKTWSSSGTTIITPDMDRSGPRKESTLRLKQANADKQNESYVGGEE
jgi:Tfp pilus assembly protein PilV